MAFADLSVKLTADIRNFAKGMQDAVKQTNKVQKALNSGVGGKAASWITWADSLRNKYKESYKELRAHNLGLKDTSRIVQGIMVSQAFYAAAQTIRNATSALWDFNVSLDYMKVTYSALFGSTKVAEDFMSVLQEHSIETIFDYQTLADASKKLLAYGIEYENLMFIMEGLTNLGAMSGDAAALDRISLALGQIFTKGKLDATEMKQLANAYIPITEILQDKFGLTGEELDRVGDLNLPAAEVINAIVDYANENFASVGDAAMLTITGLQNRIVDTLKVVGASMMQPLTKAYKSFLVYVSRGLEDIRSAYASGGVGGIFEFLVPDEGTQQVIRQFIANVRNLFMALVRVGNVAGQVFGNMFSVIANAFNILSPIITGFINILAAVANSFLRTEVGAKVLRVALVGAAAAFVLLKAQAIGSLVITAVTKAVTNLSKALLLLSAIVSKHPIIAILVGIAAVLIGVSVASNKANSSISGLFDTISGAAGGSSSDDVLQKVNQGLTDGANAANQFNNRLNEGADAANNLKDAIGGAGKAAKKTSGLLSFDEVFKLPEQKEESDAGGGAGGLLGSLEDLTKGFEGLSGLGDALMPDIPDFGDYFSEFTDSLFGGIDESIVSKIKSASVGSMIGALIGLLVGTIFKNPVLGAKIGTAAGAIVGLIWDSFDGAISNTGVGGAAGVWATIGGYLAKSGAKVGFGTLLANAFKTGGFKGMWQALAKVIKGTGGKALLKGGLIGMAVGFVVDGIAHLLWSTLEEKFGVGNAETAKVGQTIGSLIGTVIGGLIGGPAGALIGSGIGTFVGGFVGLFWKEIKTKFKESGSNLGTIIGSVFGGIPGGIIGTWLYDNKLAIASWATDTYGTISAWATDTLGSFSGWWSDTFSGFDTWWTDTKDGISGWWEDTVAIFSDWDSINSETLDSWWSDTKAGFTTWYTDTKTSLTTWWTETTAGFTTWWTDTKTGISTWWTETTAGFTTWASDTLAPLRTWWDETKINFGVWAHNTLVSIVTWCTNAKTNITMWCTNTKTNFTTWWTTTKAGFNRWVTDVKNVIIGFTLAAGKKFDAWLAGTWTNWTTWFTTTKAKVKTNWEKLFDPNTWRSGWSILSSWFSTLFSNIYTWFSNLGPNISNWWSNLWSGKEVSVSSTNGFLGSAYLGGHAAGGVFNREHIARFAEGNKAEAIIPLENNRAMQPFVDAVANGLVSTLAPIMAQSNSGNSNNLPPLYVGTLIADDRGLRELYKKFEVIQLQENDRRGIHSPA